MRFVAVYHKWFVSHEGWYTEFITARDKTEAYNQALVTQDQMRRTLLKVEFTLIELADDTKVLFGQKLSWAERIFGRARLPL